MKVFLLILMLPLYCFAQQPPNEKLRYKATIITDSATIHGYFVSSIDSAIIISPQKRYLQNSTTNIPVTSIKEMHLKNRKVYWGGVAALTVLGFIVTAGLTKNGGDVDNDGKTSFWELIFTAIEGSTSSNKRRRKTALIVGGFGGTAGLLLGIFVNRKFSLVFPLNNRNGFYSVKKYDLIKYLEF